MWQVTAGQQTNCFVCEGQISPGSQCISDLPQQLPKKVNRRDYRYFHLERPEPGGASDGPSESCYQVFAAQLRPERAKQEAVCLLCGHLVLEGEELLQDFFYVRDDRRKYDDLENNRGPAALLVALAKGQQVKPAPFLSQLSGSMQNKFSIAGLGRGRGGIRGPAAAQEFYRSSIPGPVRNLGEGPVRQFTQGKQASHIRSVANAPGQARNSANIIWESAKANTARGSRNMTKLELVGARTANTAHAAGIVGVTAAKRAGRGALWTAVLELPVSLAENGINVFRGKKTRKEALKDTGKDMATAGVAGGAVAAGTTVAISLGAGPALLAAGPVLVPVGVGLFAVSAGNRIRRAWRDNLARVELSFHATCPDCEPEENCYAAFAEWVSAYGMATSEATPPAQST